MGALRRIRGRRVLYAVGVAALVGPALVAVGGCQPSGDGLDSITAAVTTGKRATDRLKDQGYYVRWLTCSGKEEGGGTTDKGSPRPVTAVGVDCEGRTGGGQKIIVFGRVTGIDGDGSCVRGRLTGKVDGKTVFAVTVLGDCASAHPSGSPFPTPTPTPTWSPPPPDRSPSPSCTPSSHGK
ncbi:hypothetical protein [Streptomyces sp. NPDC002537]